jgi:hypothetical protein
VAHVHIEPNAQNFRTVARALRDEGDGRELKRELAEEFRDILGEIVDEQRGLLMGMSSGGLPHAGEPLRQAISAGLKISVRTTGKAAGARIRAVGSRVPRNFRNAPKRFNAHEFRHPIFGTAVWVTQISGAEGWFDRPIEAHRAKARRRAERALEDMALRIQRKTKR